MAKLNNKLQAFLKHFVYLLPRCPMLVPTFHAKNNFHSGYSLCAQIVIPNYLKLTTSRPKDRGTSNGSHFCYVSLLNSRRILGLLVFFRAEICRDKMHVAADSPCLIIRDLINSTRFSNSERNSMKALLMARFRTARREYIYITVLNVVTIKKCPMEIY